VRDGEWFYDSDTGAYMRFDANASRYTKLLTIYTEFTKVAFDANISQGTMYNWDTASTETDVNILTYNFAYGLKQPRVRTHQIQTNLALPPFNNSLRWYADTPLLKDWRYNNTYATRYMKILLSDWFDNINFSTPDTTFTTGTRWSGEERGTFDTFELTANARALDAGWCYGGGLNLQSFARSEVEYNANPYYQETIQNVYQPHQCVLSVGGVDPPYNASIPGAITDITVKRRADGDQHTYDNSDTCTNCAPRYAAPIEYDNIGFYMIDLDDRYY
jgi:hypothetical protein